MLLPRIPPPSLFLPGLRRRLGANLAGPVAGVSWNRSSQRWVAQLRTPIDGKVNLKAWETEEEAAYAFDVAAFYCFHRCARALACSAPVHARGTWRCSRDERGGGLAAAAAVAAADGPQCFAARREPCRGAHACGPVACACAAGRPGSTSQAACTRSPSCKVHALVATLARPWASWLAQPGSSCGSSRGLSRQERPARPWWCGWCVAACSNAGARLPAASLAHTLAAAAAVMQVAVELLGEGKAATLDKHCLPDFDVRRPFGGGKGHLSLTRASRGTGLCSPAGLPPRPPPGVARLQYWTDAATAARGGGGGGGDTAGGAGGGAGAGAGGAGGAADAALPRSASGLLMVDEEWAREQHLAQLEPDLALPPLEQQPRGCARRQTFAQTHPARGRSASAVAATPPACLPSSALLATRRPALSLSLYRPPRTAKQRVNRGKSAYRGVCWSAKRARFEARLTMPGSRGVYIRRVVEEKEAARSADAGAYVLFGKCVSARWNTVRSRADASHSALCARGGRSRSRSLLRRLVVGGGVLPRVRACARARSGSRTSTCRTSGPA